MKTKKARLLRNAHSAVFCLFLSFFFSIFILPSPIQAAPGGLDPSFGIGGIVTTPIGEIDDIAYALAIQLDGKIVAAGYSYDDVLDEYTFALTRYNTDGSLDTTFGFQGTVNTEIGTISAKAFAVKIQSDGKLVVAGYTNYGTRVNPLYKFALVRYQTDGSLDTTFGTGGIVTTAIGSYDDRAYGLVIQPDGKLVVAGYSYNTAGDWYEFALVRYNTNGSLDAPFGTAGKATKSIGNYDDTAYALAIQPDGKLVAAGYSYNSTLGDNLFALVRFTTTGSLDTTFGTAGIVTTSIGADEDGINSLAIQSDGKLVAAGYSYNTSLFIYQFALTRYNSSGSLDTTFGTGGIVTTSIGEEDVIESVAIQPDGKLVAAGYSYNTSLYAYVFALARYNTNGSLDPTFGTGGFVTTAIGTSTNFNDDSAYALAIQPNGMLVAAGYAYVESQYEFGLTRYLGGLTVTIPTGASVCTPSYISICAYAPNPLTITSGDSVVWSNGDALSHTATSDDHSDTFALAQPVAPANSFSTAVLSGGGSSPSIGPFINPTGSPQTKPYHCSFHPATMKGTLIINPNHSPTADSLTPVNINTVVGIPQTFTLVLSDPDGWQDIAAANLYFAGALNNDWLHYFAAPNLFTMLGSNDICSPGQATTISSGFLTLDCGASTVSGSGNRLTVNFRVTPQPSFIGVVYNLFFAVSDQFGGADAKYGGTWLVSLTTTSTTTTTTTTTTTSTTTTTIPINNPPSADSLTPVNITTAVGTPQTFTLVLSDLDGWQNIAVANLYLAGDLNNDWLHYLVAPNLFTMLGTNDLCSPGQAITISSGFLTLDCGASTVSGSGNTLTVNFRVTPQPSFAGVVYNLFFAVSDQFGGADAKYGGTWLVTATTTSTTTTTTTTTTSTTTSTTIL